MLNKKNKILVIIILTMLVVVYKFALSNTIAEFTTNQSLKEIFIKDAKAQKEKLILERKNVVFDSILSKHNMSLGSTQNQLLSLLTRESDSLDFKILSFSEPHRFSDSSKTIMNYSFTLEGNYVGLVKLIYKLEKNGSFGKVVNTAFKKKKDYRTQKLSLEATIFLEQYEF